MDPCSSRTYLFCEATENWHWEEPDSSLEVPVQMPDVDVSAQSAPATCTTSFTCTDPQVVDLVKNDPILRDLVRDELRLRKKLREIDTLETAAAAGQQLLETQLAKLARRGTILSDLQLIAEQIDEAKEQLQQLSEVSSPNHLATSIPSSRSGARVRPKPKVPRTDLDVMDPLPQRGKVPMPVPAQVANAGLAGNTASRLAAYAPLSTTPTKSAGLSAASNTKSSGRDSAGGIGLRAGCVSQTLAARVPATVNSEHHQTITQGGSGPSAAVAEPWRPAVPPPPIPGSHSVGAGDQDDGFKQVKRKMKAKARR